MRSLPASPGRGEEASGLLQRRALEAMRHGADPWKTAGILGLEVASIVDFSANINPFVPREALRKAAEEGLSRMDHYPEAGAENLLKAIADHRGIDKEELVLGNGGADLIFRIAQGMAISGIFKERQNVLTTAPTFSEYQTAFSASGFRVVHHALEEKNAFCLNEDILEAMTDDKALLILCEPNNPTGLKTERSLLRKILKKAEQNGISLLLDLSFLDFLSRSSQELMEEELDQFSGTMIRLYSFTKFYAIPGLRLGWARVQNAELRNFLLQLTPPWQISAPAMAAGSAALRFRPEEEDDWRRRIRVEKEKIKTVLLQTGARVYGGEANYLFFRHPDPDFQLRLLQEGSPPCLVRNCANYPGLGPGFFRIGVQHPQQNEQICAVLNHLFPQQTGRPRQLRRTVLDGRDTKNDKGVTL